MKQEMPRLVAAGSVTAKTNAMSAERPEVMNCFTPFSTQPLPRRSARVRRFEDSEPASASGGQKAPTPSPPASGFHHPSFRSGGPYARGPPPPGDFVTLSTGER